MNAVCGRAAVCLVLAAFEVDEVKAGANRGGSARGG